MATESKSKAKAQKVEAAEKMAEQKKPIIAKDIDLNQLVVVRNGYQGRLVYKSPRTHEKFVWPEFGSEQMIELLELRNAKNTFKKYFINNWFMFDDEYSWVVDYLGLSQYYKYALRVDGFDDIFSKTPSEIEKIIAKLSAGQKKSIGYRARQLISAGEIDSNKAILALEKSLGLELIER